MLRATKRLITALIVFALCFTLVACGKTINNEGNDKNITTPTTEEETVMIDFSDLTKLNMSCLGDSLTMGQGIETPYSTFIEEELGLKEVYNYGIGWSTIANSGTCTCHPQNFAGGHNPFVYRYMAMNQAEIIAVCGGANDHGVNVPLGTIDDVKGNTFYGALNNLITGLQESNPGAYIFFMTPFNYDTVNDNGIHIYEYAEAIKKVCEKHEIDCFDCYAEIPINVGTDTIDGVHPTQEFVQNTWAPQIAQFIRDNVG